VVEHFGFIADSLPSASIQSGVVFRCNVGDNVTVGEGAIIAGPGGKGSVPELEIPDGTKIPDGAVITDQEELDGVLKRQ
jgi:carbonic anhydrase/acetyltransferase-like protein (isoleucine patch superfamily)